MVDSDRSEKDHSDEAVRILNFPMEPSEFQISYPVESYDKKLPKFDKILTMLKSIYI